MSRFHRPTLETKPAKYAPYSSDRTKKQLGRIEGDGELDLHRLSVVGDAAGIERVLSAHNANTASVLMAADSRQRTVLHFACAHGHVDVVRVVLRYRLGLDGDSIVRNRIIGARDANGNTPLHLAVTCGHLGIVSLLVWAGADLSSLDVNARTPLQLVQGRLRSLKARQLMAPSSDDSDVYSHSARRDLIRELNDMIDIIQVYSNKKDPFSAQWISPVINSLNAPLKEDADISSLEAKFKLLSASKSVAPPTEDDSKAPGLGQDDKHDMLPLDFGNDADVEDNITLTVTPATSDPAPQMGMDPKMAHMIDEIGSLLDTLHV
ncbi:hypothetical protein HDU77_003394 [Chytriomyces hyalinus]|nr:hypothetical protein HDU77_003394 [Chytriomyces hyalinus]